MFFIIWLNCFKLLFKKKKKHFHQTSDEIFDIHTLTNDLLSPHKCLILSSHWIQPPLIVSDTESIIQTWSLSAQTQGRSFNQLMVHRASGASERNTLSSCGTNREALMPHCHCQYIRTMMMFPHKYFMLYAASKTHSVWMEEETCVLSLLKGSWLKVNEKKSLDAPYHEG